MTRDEFRELVEEAIDTIPRRFAREVRNLAIVIESEPTEELLDEMDIDEEGSLLGLYQGTPLNERGWSYGNQLPDKITLFQDTIEDECNGDEDEIIVAIGETLIHELGHYFGLSEAEIMDIEERYWRGEPEPGDEAEAAAGKPADPDPADEAEAAAGEPADPDPADEPEAAADEPADPARKAVAVKPRKRFAQHFLEPAWVKKVVAAVGATTADIVLEIGPGRAAITLPLAAQAGRVLAIEIDRDLAAALDANKPGNVTVVCGDFLSLDLPRVLEEWLGSPPGPAHRVRVVGNLPYNISSPILFRLLDFAATTGGLSDATLMLQREVADRLTARVGTGDYGVLTILTAVYADVKRVLALPPGAFRPQPRVQSAVVRLSFRPSTVAISDHAAFVRMVRSMFTQRRKTLLNALKPFAAERSTDAGSALSAAGIDPKRRPETLTMPELAELARRFVAPGS